MLRAQQLAATEGKSVSAIAREIGVGWRTVKRWLDPEYADEVRVRVRDSYRRRTGRGDSRSRATGR